MILSIDQGPFYCYKLDAGGNSSAILDLNLPLILDHHLIKPSDLVTGIHGMENPQSLLMDIRFISRSSLKNHLHFALTYT